LGRRHFASSAPARDRPESTALARSLGPPVRRPKLAHTAPCRIALHRVTKLRGHTAHRAAVRRLLRRMAVDLELRSRSGHSVRGRASIGVVDVCSRCGPSYDEWHDFAKIWQAPQAGGDFWAQQLGASTQERAGVFQMLGVPEEPALDLASHRNRAMADCILGPCRSAVDAGRRWGPDFAAIPVPGLVIIPSEDPFLSAPRRSSPRAGAKTAALDGFGHWWMLRDPAGAATVRREFWATLA
jgi:hypothetical protein